MGDGAPGMLQIVAPSAQAQQAATTAAQTPGISMITPPLPALDGTNYVLMQALPAVDPSDAELGTIDVTGHDFDSTRKYRNVSGNPKAAKAGRRFA
jgi:hypothetical protein